MKGWRSMRRDVWQKMRAARRVSGLALCAAAWLGAAPGRAQVQPSSYGEAATVDAALVRVPRASRPPMIDGVMEPGEWSDAAAIASFWRARGSKFSDLAPRVIQNRAYMMYDATHLYIAVIYPVYPEGTWLRARGRFPNVLQHPQYGIISDDHIEIELRPAADAAAGFKMGLLRWDVNSLNTYCDWLWSLKGGGFDRSWQSGATMRSTVDKERWTLEFAVPFASLRALGYAGDDEHGRPLVAVPPPDGTIYRFWFRCGLGGAGVLNNVFDQNIWNTTKGQLVFDSQCVAFQVNDLGPIEDDVIDVQISVKNHNTRSETMRLGFFVENPGGLIYSSYDAPELNKGMLELRPGEERQLRLRKPLPGVADEGNLLWFDVRSAGRPAKVMFRARLMRFHSSAGGLEKVNRTVINPVTGEPVRDPQTGDPIIDTTMHPYVEVLPDILNNARPQRTDFDASMQISHYDKRLFVLVDRGVAGASEESGLAAEAKLTVTRDDLDGTVVREFRAGFKADFAHFLVDVPELVEGERYKVSLLLFDASKRIVGDKNLGKFLYQGGPWKDTRLGLDDVVWEGFAPIGAKGDTLEMKKHRFTVSPQGLPAQIVIKPDPRELPLERRAAGAAALIDAELLAIGRGPQLRAPVTLSAVIDGKRVTGKITQPAKAARAWKSEIEYRAEMAFGDLPVSLVSRYDCDGVLYCRLEYGGEAPVTVDLLELEMPVDGLVDMGFSETGRSGGMAAADQWEIALPDTEGVIWDSKKFDRELAYGRFIPWFWFGSGDRGFTFWCDSSQGWTMDAEGSTLRLERDQAGKVTLKIQFVNHTAEIKGARAIDFTLMTHPAKDKPERYRAAGWHYTLGHGWCAGYAGEPHDMSEEDLRRQWRQAARAPTDWPEEKAAEWRRDEPPFLRYGKHTYLNPNTHRVTEPLHQTPAFSRFDRMFEDKGTHMYERQVRVGRRVGWHYDEAWPIGFGYSDNLALGDGYLVPPEQVTSNTPLPWAGGYVTRNMRGHYKRLARLHQINNVPQRHQSWANNEATLHESCWWSCFLVEECGALHRSYEVDVVTQFPSSLYRYLAHTFSGLAAAAMADATFADYGDDRRLDRQILGRALLHDIGVTPQGPHGIIYHKEDVIRLLKRLTDFGFFREEAVEALPYWRSAGAVRIGDKPSPESEVYVTAYRRLLPGGKGGEAVFVVMNESDRAVELPLRLVDEKRLLGGPNTLKAGTVLGATEVHGRVAGWWGKASGDGGAIVLMDLESGDVVARQEGEAAAYGPVHIPYHDFRVFVARHEEGK